MVSRASSDAFSAYHPAVAFLFFAGAIVLGMFILHPVASVTALLASSCYYFLLKGKKGLAAFLGLLVMIPLISVVNALLVTEGETVLLTLWKGRPVTLEALVYGLGTGMTFVSVILWFACYSVVMTSDKFISLFGRLIPSLSLLLCMIFRLIPGFTNKASVIAGARRCIGKAPADGEKAEKLRSSGDVLSVLTSWAFENAVITADSMRSRGYGTGERSNFSIFRRDRRDLAAFVLLAVCAAAVLAAMFSGSMRAEFYPALDLGTTGIPAFAGEAAYAVFLFTPSFLHIREELVWRILRSKI